LGAFLVLKLRFGFGFPFGFTFPDRPSLIEAELQEKRFPSGAWEPERGGNATVNGQ
jgi:hypothetical protein